MCSIRNVDYGYIKQLKIPDRTLILTPDGEYYVLEYKNIVVSVIVVKRAKNGVKLHYNYTYPEYRGNGYFSKLLEYIIEKYKDYNLYADCLIASRNIYLRHGFEEYKVKEFKYFTNYYMRRLRS